jgi:hypothetical protein
MVTKKPQTPEQKAAAEAKKADTAKNKANTVTAKTEKPAVNPESQRSPDAPALNTPPAEQTQNQKDHVTAFNRYVELHGEMPNDSLSTVDLQRLNQEKENANLVKEVKNPDAKPEAKGEVSTKEDSKKDPLMDGPSASLEKILGDVKSGKKIKNKHFKGVYFLFNNGKLDKHDEESGSFLDSAPLYSYQDKDGWSVEK